MARLGVLLAAVVAWARARRRRLLIIAGVILFFYLLGYFAPQQGSTPGMCLIYG
ncbi:hypothetical protein [Pseudothauera lacus]|uniref:hypothetical protein n=1 Tax=Pseudothauera lacus TaxID=2136175 RepID=UPI0015E744D4|nr:hypothetical protein [Pseudothauera lacus]